MMKIRLAAPGHFADIIGIAGGTSQAEILSSGLLGEKCPSLPQAAAGIADPQARNCGAVGDNRANGDPGDDCPAIMMALDAS